MMRRSRARRQRASTNGQASPSTVNPEPFERGARITVLIGRHHARKLGVGPCQGRGPAQQARVLARSRDIAGMYSPGFPQLSGSFGSARDARFIRRLKFVSFGAVALMILLAVVAVRESACRSGSLQNADKMYPTYSAVRPVRAPGQREEVI